MPKCTISLDYKPLLNIKHNGRISLNLGKTVLPVLPLAAPLLLCQVRIVKSCEKQSKRSTKRFWDFRTLILSFYSLVFLRHFPRMLRLVVFSSKTKSYQEQKTREIAMAKPAKVILNNSCVELSLILQCTHGRRKVHEHILVILAAQPGPNGQLFCLHSFKNFSPMKPSYTSNEMTWFAAHFDVLKNINDNFQNMFLCKPAWWFTE